MRHVLAAVLCIVIPVAVFAGDNGYKVSYDGGSLPDTKAGVGMKIYIESNQVRLVKDNADVVKIPASAIRINAGGSRFRHGFWFSIILVAASPFL